VGSLPDGREGAVGWNAVESGVALIAVAALVAAVAGLAD
jgi:uncharacterized membrane protein